MSSPRLFPRKEHQPKEKKIRKLLRAIKNARPPWQSKQERSAEESDNDLSDDMAELILEEADLLDESDDDDDDDDLDDEDLEEDLDDDSEDIDSDASSFVGDSDFDDDDDDIIDDELIDDVDEMEEEEEELDEPVSPKPVAPVSADSRSGRGRSLSNQFEVIAAKTADMDSPTDTARKRRSTSVSPPSLGEKVEEDWISPNSASLTRNRKEDKGFMLSRRSDTLAIGAVVDTAVRFGDAIRLYTVSRYADANEPGGYIGYFLHGGSSGGSSTTGGSSATGDNKSFKSRGRLLAAVPPIGGQFSELFAESCFEVVDPTGTKKEGELLRYGDEVVLLDDMRLVWNNVQGQFGGIGPRLPGARGEMHLKFRRTSVDGVDGEPPPPDSDVVNYGDSDVVLDVITLRRRVGKEKYSQTISNYKRQRSRSSPEGGYLVSNGRGMAISFAIHNAQPYVAKLSIRAPHKDLQHHNRSNKALGLSAASRGSADVHHNVGWGQPIAFTASPEGLPSDAGARKKAAAAVRASVAASSGSSAVGNGGCSGSGASDSGVSGGGELQSTALEAKANDPSSPTPGELPAKLLHSTASPGVVVFVLTNGGRGVVSSDQIVAASADKNGFWVDLFTNGKNKGCVRVSCYREEANQLQRRLSMRKSGEGGLDYGAILQQNRPGALLLRKLDRLRKIPKLMESNMRHLKGRFPKHEGFEEGLREFKGNLRKAPHHLVHGVRRVGGGIKGHIDKGVGKIKKLRPGRRLSSSARQDEMDGGPTSDDDQSGGYWQPGVKWAEHRKVEEEKSASPSAATPSRSRKFGGIGSFGLRREKRDAGGGASAVLSAGKSDTGKEITNKPGAPTPDSPKRIPKSRASERRKRALSKARKAAKEANSKTPSRKGRRRARHRALASPSSAVKGSGRSRRTDGTNKAGLRGMLARVVRSVQSKRRWTRRRLRPILRIGAATVVLAAVAWQPEDENVIGAIAFLSHGSTWAPVAYRAVVLAHRLYELLVVAPIYAIADRIHAAVPWLVPRGIAATLLSAAQDDTTHMRFGASGCPVCSATETAHDGSEQEASSPSAGSFLGTALVLPQEMLAFVLDPMNTPSVPLNPAAQKALRYLIVASPLFVALLFIAAFCGYAPVRALHALANKYLGIDLADFDEDGGADDKAGLEEVVWELTLHEWDPRTADELNATIQPLPWDTEADGELNKASPGAGANVATSGGVAVEAAEKRAIGQSLTIASELSPGADWENAWAEVPANTFNLRGANYLSDKKKAPSETALFETIMGDCVMAGGPIRHFASRMNVPDYSDELPYLKRHTGSNAASPVPAVIIFNCQIPLQTRAMFGAQKLPPTINAVFYMRLRKEAAEWLAKFEEDNTVEVPGSIRLLHRWCRDSMTDELLRGQLKAVANATNLDEIGAPGFIASWNGKPVLLARSSVVGGRAGICQMYRNARYLELDIDAAAEFSYLAQRGICWGMSKLSELIVNVAFTIEARESEELPECALGTASLIKMPLATAADEATMFPRRRSSQL